MVDVTHTLRRHAAALRELGSDAFFSQVAADAADDIEAQLKRDLDGGRDAYGEPMAPRKDGKPAMVGAFDKYVRVNPIGDTVLIRLRGKVPVLHHYGDGRGADVKRRLIPVKTIPKHWIPRVRKAVVRSVRGVLRG